MPLGRSTRGGGLGALLLATVVGLGATRGAGFRADELECEEAAAHLADCCPALDVGQLDCSYDDGCGGPPSYPVLSEVAARCIRDLSCDGVRRHGWCDPQLYGPEAAPMEDCR